MIGARLVDRLRRQGQEVTAAARSTGSTSSPAQGYRSPWST